MQRSCTTKEMWEVYIILDAVTSETQREKNVPYSMRPTNTRISLRICTVWSDVSLSAWRTFASLFIQNMPSEDSEQTAKMRRLIRIFTKRTSEGTFSDVVAHLLFFSCNNIFVRTCWFTIYLMYTLYRG